MPPDSTSPKQAPPRWPKGTSGNPSGRPKGARHKALVALDAIGTRHAEVIMQAVVDAAKGGDMRAADILLRRLWPERKGRPIALNLPLLTDAADVQTALARIVAAAAGGEITADEASAMASLVEAQRRAIETIELESRLRAIEERIEAGDKSD